MLGASYSSWINTAGRITQFSQLDVSLTSRITKPGGRHANRRKTATMSKVVLENSKSRLLVELFVLSFKGDL